jgi:hypothetical protein
MVKNTFIEIVSPFTMTSVERMGALYDSLEYIRANNIKGDFVECGVWKGGNILGIMEYLAFHKMTDRKVFLYDTFKGMTPPEDIDKDLNGRKAESILEDVMCISPIDEVRETISRSSFPMANVIFVQGDVCVTLNGAKYIHESNLALLRLDTDWYASTKKEMEVLYPKLNFGGVLIVDDYGHWKGSKTAVDEYFEGQGISPKIEQIDYTGIKIIKNG